MSEHTPGPWAIVNWLTKDSRRRVEIQGNDCGDRVAVVTRTRDPSNDAMWTTERWDANARLIAAAPELLAAAKRALPDLWGDEDQRDSEAAFDISDAIAKAEGT